MLRKTDAKIMTSDKEKLSQLKRAYDNGILDLNTFESAVKGLGISITDSQIAVVGDNAKIEGGVQYGGVSIKKLIKVYEQSEDPDPADILRIYRQQLVRTLQYLPLRGLEERESDPSGHQERLELQRIFIDLDTKTSVPVSEKKDEARPLSALEAVVQNRHLVILGDPGAGKSTFVNHLALCLASHDTKDCLTDRLPCWGKEELYSVPIHVVLRDFARWIPEGTKEAEASLLWKFIAGRLDARKLNFAGKVLEDALEEGQAIVLLDGMDEIASREKRIFVRDAVASFSERYEKSRFVVTCRVLSYQDPQWKLDEKAFPVFELSLFDEIKINAFIKAWYADLVRLNMVSAAEAHELGRKLKDAIHRPDLWRLAPNPLLLTVMALVNTHKGRLPDARALLYEETIDILLWRWEQVKSGSEALPLLRELLLESGRADVDLKKVLWRLAFKAHEETEKTDTEEPADIGEWELEKALAALHPNGSKDWASRLIRTIKMRAGLLLEREPEVFSFPHRTFQEYLAGAHLSTLSDFAQRAAALVEAGNFWREVVLLAVGRLVYLTGDFDKPLVLVGELCPEEVSDDETSWRKVWMAGEVLLEIGVNRLNDSKLARDFTTRVQRRLVALLERDVLSPKERVAAGNALSRLGDPRFDPENFYLPKETNMGFVTIPAGPFLMGSDKEKDTEAFDDELPQHTVELSEYAIGRYPVTVAQFSRFIENSGYRPGYHYCREGNEYANHPVVNLSWHDAKKYCEWLSEKLNDTGFYVDLPTEAQWEKAARGEEGRIYPCGNELLSGKANYGGDIGSSSAVGTFFDDLSPFGCMDMTGNVKEWCLDWPRAYSENMVTDPMGTSKKDSRPNRVLRAGCWCLTAQYCRSASRGKHTTVIRNDILGFRLVLLPVRP